MFFDSCIGLVYRRVCRENSERKDRAKPGADGGGLYTKDFSWRDNIFSASLFFETVLLV
jgi:hypothetical protein